MGYSDRKTRIIDVVLTTRGRREFAEGSLNIKYYAFSDDEVDYRTKYENQHPMSGSDAITESKRATLCYEPSPEMEDLSIKYILFDNDSNTKPRLNSSTGSINIEQKIKRITMHDAYNSTSRGARGTVTFIAREHPAGSAVPVREHPEGTAIPAEENDGTWLDDAMEMAESDDG